MRRDQCSYWENQWGFWVRGDSHRLNLSHHYITVVLSPAGLAVGPSSCVLSVFCTEPINNMWVTAWALISSGTPRITRNNIQPKMLLMHRQHGVDVAMQLRNHCWVNNWHANYKLSVLYSNSLWLVNKYVTLWTVAQSAVFNAFYIICIHKVWFYSMVSCFIWQGGKWRQRSIEVDVLHWMIQLLGWHQFK